MCHEFGGLWKEVVPVCGRTWWHLSEGRICERFVSRTRGVCGDFLCLLPGSRDEQVPESEPTILSAVL